MKRSLTAHQNPTDKVESWCVVKVTTRYKEDSMPETILKQIERDELQNDIDLVDLELMCAHGSDRPFPCQFCSLVSYGRNCRNEPVEQEN